MTATPPATRMKRLHGGRLSSHGARAAIVSTAAPYRYSREMIVEA